MAEKFIKNSEGQYVWFFNWKGGGYNTVLAKTKLQAIKKATQDGYPTYMPDNQYARERSLRDVKEMFGNAAVKHIRSQSNWSNKDQKSTPNTNLKLSDVGFSSGLVPDESTFRKETSESSRQTTEMGNRMAMEEGGGIGDAHPLYAGGGEIKEYTVWVGGTEVNDFLLTKEKAEELAESYIEDGYDDVAIDKVYAKGGEVNGKYLDSISADKKSKILNNIAKHYGISSKAAEEEVIDLDAENLFEYIANDNSLRREVYNDFERKNYGIGGFIAGVAVGVGGATYLSKRKPKSKSKTFTAKSSKQHTYYLDGKKKTEYYKRGEGFYGILVEEKGLYYIIDTGAGTLKLPKKDFSISYAKGGSMASGGEVKVDYLSYIPDRDKEEVNFSENYDNLDEAIIQAKRKVNQKDEWGDTIKSFYINSEDGEELYDYFYGKREIYYAKGGEIREMYGDFYGEEPEEDMSVDRMRIALIEDYDNQLGKLEASIDAEVDGISFEEYRKERKEINKILKKLNSYSYAKGGEIILLESVGTYFRPSDKMTSIGKDFHADESTALGEIENDEWFEALSSKDRKIISKYYDISKRKVGRRYSKGGSIKKSGYFTGALSFLNW